MAHAPVIERHCAYSRCERPLRRGREESRRDFAKRQYCGLPCYYAAHPRQPRVHRPAVRPPGMKKCRCGVLTETPPCGQCRLEAARGRYWLGMSTPECLGRFIRSALSDRPRPHAGEEGRTWLDAILDHTQSSRPTLPFVGAVVVRGDGPTRPFQTENDVSAQAS